MDLPTPNPRTRRYPRYDIQTCRHNVAYRGADGTMYVRRGVRQWTPAIHEPPNYTSVLDETLEEVRARETEARHRATDELDRALFEIMERTFGIDVQLAAAIRNSTEPTPDWYEVTGDDIPADDSTGFECNLCIENTCHFAKEFLSTCTCTDAHLCTKCAERCKRLGYGCPFCKSSP